LDPLTTPHINLFKYTIETNAGIFAPLETRGILMSDFIYLFIYLGGGPDFFTFIAYNWMAHGPGVILGCKCNMWVSRLLKLPPSPTSMFSLYPLNYGFKSDDWN